MTECNLVIFLMLGQCNTDSLQPCLISPNIPDKAIGWPRSVLKSSSCLRGICVGKSMWQQLFLLTEKWLKRFSYKFLKISEQNQLWVGNKQDQLLTKTMFRTVRQKSFCTFSCGGSSLYKLLVAEVNRLALDFHPKAASVDHLRHSLVCNCTLARFCKVYI